MSDKTTTFLDRIGDRVLERLGLTRDELPAWHMAQERAMINGRKPSLWTDALEIMASSQEERCDRPYDMFWPRFVDNLGRPKKARPALPSERKVYRDLQTPLPVSLDTSDPDCWQRLLGRVAMESDFSDLKTLEWLFAFAAIYQGMYIHIIDEYWKQPLFDCLVAMYTGLSKRKETFSCRPPRFWNSGNPYVWLSVEEELPFVPIEPLEYSNDHASSRPSKQVRWETIETSDQFYKWLSWMYNSPIDACKSFYESSARARSESEFVQTVLLKRVKRIVYSRHLLGLECSYVWDQEWDIVDDPMRFVSKFFPTWENSMHPLYEMCVLPSMPGAVDYLVARLACWARDTSTAEERDLSKDAVFMHNNRVLEENMLIAASQIIREDADKVSESESAQDDSQVGESQVGEDASSRVSEASNTSEPVFVGQAANESETKEEAYRPSSLIDRIRLARQARPIEHAALPSQESLDSMTTTVTPMTPVLMGIRGHVDENMRYAIQQWKHSGPRRVTHEEIMERTCVQAIKSSWTQLCAMLPKVSLGSWDTLLPQDATHAQVTCRGAYEDLVELIKYLPVEVLVWDHERADKGFTESIQSTVGVIDTLKYWCCYFARHGALGRCVFKHSMDNSQWKGIADYIASSMAAMSVMFNKESTQRVNHLWSTKSMQILSLLGSVSVQALAGSGSSASRSIELMCVYMLSVLARDGWLLLSYEATVWKKCLGILSYEGERRDALGVTYSYQLFMHNWLDSFCRPSSFPDEVGVDWTLATVNCLLRAHYIEEVQGARAEMVSLAKVGTKRPIYGAWSSFRPKRERQAVESRLAAQEYTARGATLFFEYLDYLVRDVVFSQGELRDTLLSYIAIDRELALTEGASKAVPKWLEWLEREAYRWFDRDSFVLGGKMSLFGDHPWVQMLYWSEWLGRPWSRYYRTKTKKQEEKLTTY